MNKQEAKLRIDKLKKEINHHRYLYHVLDKQEISDAALDSLKRELFDLENQFPDLITKDSPTQRVSGKALDQFQKVTHHARMLSLNDAFSNHKLLEWEARIKKILPSNIPVQYFSELKMDGLAITLIYRDGVLRKGATRGDGKVGEEVTQNIKTVEAIPLRLDLNVLPEAMRKNAQKELEIRGEIFMMKSVFEEVSRE